jgi:hypothetical protein
MTAATSKTFSSLGCTSEVYREILSLIKPGSPEIDLTMMTMRTWNKKLPSQDHARNKPQTVQTGVKMKLTDRLWTIGSKQHELRRKQQ